MELIKELIEAAKVSRKSAASVYHRDYERTKNKAYRKYDPRKHKSTEEEEVSDAELDGAEDQIEEGAWDFVKGAAGYAGGKVKQAVGNAVQAGQTQSAMADLTKKIGQLAQALATYDKLKPAQAPQQQQAKPRQQVNPARQRNPQNQQPGKPSDAVPAAFRTTEKPRIRNGEFVFSAYLQQHDGDFISEGAWDFIKGAAGYAGGQVKQAVGNAVQAGQTASNTADFQKAVAASKQLIGEIVGLIRKVGNAKQVLGQIFGQSQLNPQMQQRITKLISQKLQQTSVQQQ